VTDNTTYRIDGESTIDDNSAVKHSGDDTINVFPTAEDTVTPTPAPEQESPTDTPTNRAPDSNADGAGPGLSVVLAGFILTGAFLHRMACK